MFGQQQQQQGTMPQFPHMFGGTNLRQPAQFTASPFNVAPALPLQQQQHAADTAGRPVQPPQGQAQVPGQGLPPMGAGRFAMAFGQGAPQVVGNPNGRASLVVGPGLGKAFQAPPGSRVAQPQAISKAPQQPEMQKPSTSMTPSKGVKNSPAKAGTPASRTIADLKASLASKAKYITQLEQELESRSHPGFNGPTGESPHGESIKRLKAQLASKDALIDDLRDEVRRLKTFMGASTSRPLSRPSPRESKGTPSPRKSPGGLGSSGKLQIHPLLTGDPAFPYHSMNRDDPVDMRVEEFYNSTSSAVPIKRINRKFYSFGSTQVEIDVVNGKLLVRTEDGWNNGKYGAIEKFLVHYEPTEREKAGMPPFAN
ncbi:hypothetical protein Pmar_PMAR000271 [Perkinsus marinus ATCC 50983]|uniref:Uncharacterized protein n=1 Tax=Perkinsus marinus (strain ATCC 50983 / TXsc) TaxID=423536 RepID=C5LNZ9_PERM5|nr:hypothetical protein Pmar_PMAR000271 [Perkinsus marinus ATCC 50983]EER01581.1 hypothetical protein Pmar_PMAR000271 [Perkinsus marinus ATCC 50983]|eukprot:XP_002768863.1 hypothetical protein Pmar_PMAR000271 [Perkinsus marinus ATCC 50983]